MSIRKYNSDTFWNYVNKGSNDSCWPWSGPRNKTKKGSPSYGRCSWYGKVENAHRVAWMLHRKQNVPDKMDVCHHCDIPQCCNPSHLFIGTRKENMQDCIKKNRMYRFKGKPGESHPMRKLSEIDVKYIRNAYGNRESTEKLSDRFCVSKTQINRIATGKSWKRTDGPIASRQKQRFTISDIEQMRKMATHGISQQRIAHMYQTNQSCISRIINHVSHSKV